MILKIFIPVAIIWSFTACASMQIQKTKNPLFKPDSNATIVVIPFINYTQTPLAGYSAASMANVILQSHGYHTKAISLQPKIEKLIEENYQDSEISQETLKNKGYRYLLRGKVTEWRYKTGIDAEPVAGLVVELIDLKSSKVLYSSAGSKSAMSLGSIAGTAQNILDEILP